MENFQEFKKIDTIQQQNACSLMQNQDKLVLENY